MKRTLPAALLLSLFLNVPLRADCVGMSPNDGKRIAVRVLEGTVLQTRSLGALQGEMTVKVHRVWKGPVTTTATFYYHAVLDVGPDARTGDRRVFFASRETTDDRQAFGAIIGASPVLLVRCWGAMSPDSRVLKELGRSRTPAQD